MTVRTQPIPRTDTEIIESLTGAPSIAVEEFWTRLAAEGTPLVAGPGTRPGTERRTFLWRDDDADRVHVHVNRVTDQHRIDDGLMRRVPGTGLWVLTLAVPASIRAGYGFTPLDRGQAPPSGPPAHGRVHTRLDPLNPRPPVLDYGDAGTSVLVGSRAPGQAEWETPRAQLRAGSVLEADRYLSDDPATARPHWLYVPPGTGRLPLLTVFDAEKWFGPLGLVAALQAAQATGVLPRLAVLGVGHHERTDRIASLSANPAFLRAVAVESTAWAEERLTGAGLHLGPRHTRILAGQSLGGLSVLTAALELPHHYGGLVAQSPSLWWRPGGTARPTDLARPAHEDWIIGRFTEAAATRRPDGEASGRAPRLRVSVGTLEGPSVDHHRHLLAVLRNLGRPASLTEYCGGHDYAWWRGGLFDDLRALLGTAPRTPA